MKRKGILGGIVVVVLLLVLTLAGGGGSVSAEEPTIIASGDCGKDRSNVTWKLDSAGLLTISGEGEMEDYSAIGYAYDNWITTAPWQNRASKLIIQEGVTSIGGYAFYNCGALKSVTIPDSVTSIGGYAFNGCTGLTSVTIPNSVTNIGGYAFNGCTGLTCVTIPDSVTSIGGGAFFGCTGLTEIYYNAKSVEGSSSAFNGVGTSSGGIRAVIGDSVELIPAYLFSGCTGLTSVTIGNSVTSIGGGAFSGCTGLSSVTIPDSVTSIGGSAFYGCAGLTSVTIPNSVTNIGRSAFEGCAGLTCVTIGNGVTSIGGYAFSRCTGLTEIIYNAKAAADLGNGPDAFYSAGISSGGFRVLIGDGVEKIPGYLFSNCTGLTSVTIGNSVTSIGGYAFRGCSSLTSVTIPNSVTSIGSYAFDGCRGLTEIYYNAKAVEEVFGSFSSAGTSSGGFRAVIGDSVELIPAYLFADCRGLKSVTIGNSVTSIGGYAFYNCGALKSVTIPDSVTSIGDDAFNGCTGLTSVTIGNSVDTIGFSAFDGCTSLASVTIPDSVASIGGGAFFGCTGLSSVYYNAKSAACGVYTDHDIFGNAGTSSDGIRLIVGNNVERIPSFLFKNCVGLREIIYNAKAAADFKSSANVFTNAGTSSDGLRVVIGNSVEHIPAYLFSDCRGLKSVTIGNSVTSIGGYAFYNCGALKSVTIPDSVTGIGDFAFEGCTGLTSVTIPNGVTSIGRYAFSGCTGLTKVYYNAKSIEEENSFSYFEGAGTSSDGLRAVIGDSVERIPANLFGGCTGLTSVTIPDSVTSIGGRAFYKCTGLTSVTIPDSVTSIGYDAFSFCTSITSVTIGSGVTRIRPGAFGDCTSLREIYYNAKAVGDLAISYCVFGGAGTSTNGVKVFVGEKVKKIPAYLFYGAYGENGNNILECEFLGAPPTVGAGAFGEITRIYAYYPMHNSAWTESVRKAYGSKFYWRGYCYEPLSSGICRINKTVYMTGDTLDANGISMTVTHEDGCVETISHNSGLLKLGSYDMSTVGVKLIDVTYKDITAQLKICVYERKTEVMDKAGYPESSHDYENNLDKTYTYEAKGAITLDVTFSPQTEVETNVDYLCVNGTKYTGTALAGKTITVNGDTLTIRLVSDKSDSAYGFSIDRIVKTYINAETVVPPTCTERGYTMYLASGTVGNYVDALGHSFGDDQICSVCAAKLESIYISALPAKTVYSVGNGSLNLTGGKLMLVCDSGETEINLTAAMVSGFDNTILGKQTLTVTVGGLTTTFEVEVVERAVTSVAVENGKLVKHYTDGTTEETPLKDGAISDFAISETGEKTLTLTSENVCVAAYKDADGNYVALKAVANEDGSYSYVVPEEVTEVTVAVKGDLDGDGRINMKDLAQLRRNMAEGTVEGGLEQLLIDFNGDGVVNMKDMGILRRYLAGGYGVELGW